ncbi:hypothetical protein L596_015039 [Steinernema carpocapsae]|uniref:Uncharacterized protein n=1 Tax=Steinernema carpocapsae TaxID=34508 RepID=A0A4U5NEP8_STECR|nr:hypothetical protein L596_015039 [Steinernema carpocapsae]
MLFLALGEEEPHLQTSLDDSDSLIVRPSSTVATVLPDPCAITTSSGICIGCGLPIFDRHFLMIDSHSWHQGCLNCAICKTNLEEFGSCYLRDGVVYCRQDYSERFAKQCNRCSVYLDLNDMVMKARGRIYHVHCFVCSICQIPLEPGQMFALSEEGSLLCQNHYEPLLAFRTPLEAPIYETSDLMASLNASAKCKSSRRVKKEDILSDADTDMIDEESASGGSRSKRMRTSFKHHQLRTMKNYFHLNHNPDAKDLHSLAQKTGLTKRVLQVWFQNARAKYRRSHGQTSSGSVTIGGVAGTRETSSVSPSVVHSTSERSPSNGIDTSYFQSSCSPEMQSDDSGTSKTLSEFFEQNQML